MGDGGRAGDVLCRAIEERSGAHVVGEEGGELSVELAVEPGVGAEGYAIADAERGVRIVGGDRPGLLYGVGKFLHTSRCEEAGFVPGAWRGRSAPQCPVRGVYLAVHFGNYYESASEAELETYLEELALWGLNAVVVHFPTWQFTGLDDAGASANLARLRAVIGAAHRIGIRAGLLQAINQGYRGAPAEILAAPYPDDWARRGTLGVNVCPGRADGRRYLLDLYQRLLDEFRDIGLDYLVAWPYDEGGCGCELCWPWGARGLPSLFKELAAMARSIYPGIKTVLSTWMYDAPPAGEWEGLIRLLAEGSTWLDYVMADGHEEFPEYPLEHGVPGGLPLLNFPEISMWHMSPWGGYGANPLPGRLQMVWDRLPEDLAGGFPYSEGIYEDLNKVLCAQLYWRRERPTEEAVREYAAYEFSPDVADDIVEAVRMLELSHERGRDAPPRPSGAEKAFELVRSADGRLPDRARARWRWRLFYLRALIDAELARTGGKLEGDPLRQAFEELRCLYHVTDATLDRVRPPVEY